MTGMKLLAADRDQRIQSSLSISILRIRRASSKLPVVLAVAARLSSLFDTRASRVEKDSYLNRLPNSYRTFPQKSLRRTQTMLLILL
jgi:hypothetical protein